MKNVTSKAAAEKTGRALRTRFLSRLSSWACRGNEMCLFLVLIEGVVGLRRVTLTLEMDETVAWQI